MEHHHLSLSLGGSSQIVPLQVMVVQYIASIPESSVRLHPISLLVLVIVHPVEVLSTVLAFHRIVFSPHFSSTIAPAITVQADLDNGLLM